MEITVAKNSGFCYGVKRALTLAKRTRRERQGKVSTFGDLIHNPQVIAELKEQGIDSLESLDDVSSGTVIIRSHGVSPKIRQRLKRKKIRIVDATCPIVKKIQKLVAALAMDSKEILIVGNKEHPESQGLIGFSRGKGLIIENEAQVRSLPRRKSRAVLAQSTQDPFLFEKVVSALIEKTEELRVFNTICLSTRRRQHSTSALASEVDTLFIVGGKKSSNTNKLFQVSRRVLANTHLIEKAEQITPEMLRGAEKIGLSGGASTPPEAIQEAISKIRSSSQQHFQIQREGSRQCQR